jgi:hypothetical protein
MHEKFYEFSALRCWSSASLRAVDSRDDDTKSTFFLNVGNYLQVHTALQPRREKPISSAPQWEKRFWMQIS